MAPVGAESWMWWVGERLLTGSVQGALAVVLVWLVCRNIAAIPASARAFLWWLASLKLALALVPLPSLPVPLLPSAADNVVAFGRSLAADALTPPRVSPAALPSRLQSPADEARPVTPARTVHVWLAVAITLWLAGVAALTLHLLRVYARLRSAVRRSTPIGAEDADVVDRLASLVRLRTTPEVRVSDRVTTPLVAGIYRPTVLIPAEALATLSPGERAMAICHEFAHVRRRDLLLGWVPALAERLFFFHPLARLAAREYVVAREAACDTLVLRAMGVAPQEYGRMLVRLGVGGLDPGFMAAGSSPSISSLRRRLDMLHHLTFTGSRRRAIGLLVAVSALTLLPLRIVARAPVQPELPAAPASVLAGVDAEQATSPAPARESAQTKPAAPTVSTEAFLAEAAEDARRQAEADYLKSVEAEYRRAVEPERTADFLKREYEAKLEEYKAALVDFTGNQEPAEADLLQTAKALERKLQLQRNALELESDKEDLRRKVEAMEKTMRAVAEMRQKVEEARQADAAARYSRLLEEAARTSRNQAGTLDAQAGVARQLEALTVAQQTLIEQLKNLAAQQEQLSTMQRQISSQVEVIRRELERATRALAATPAK